MDGPGEESLRYRSLIQELRILLHKPLATHPNLLRILDLTWELDPAGTQMVVPTITTESLRHLGLFKRSLTPMKFRVG